MAQKRWWVRKAETLGGDMRREYPATPDEAFEQALEGAYFAHDCSDLRPWPQLHRQPLHEEKRPRGRLISSSAVW